MDSYDEFGLQYETKRATPEVESLVTKIIAWKNNKQTLIPEDVVNMMIDSGMITEDEVQEIIKKKPLDIQLPKSYI